MKNADQNIGVAPLPDVSNVGTSPVVVPTVGLASAMRVHKQIVNKLVHAYPSTVVRSYTRVRLTILNVNILNLLRLTLVGRQRVLDIGCGYGSLGCYLGLHEPEIRYLGCDFNPARIATAQQAARNLGLDHVNFHCGDAASLTVDGQFDAIVLVDCLHHLPDEQKCELLRNCYNQLAPGGILVLKDVTDRPWPKLAFAWLTDLIMTQSLDMWYWDEARFLRELQAAGYASTVYPIIHWLPYAHVLYVCEKGSSHLG